MKTEYLYVVIDPDGDSWRIGGRGSDKASTPGLVKTSLPSLLDEGWRPIRETAFGGIETPRILICLEREPEGSIGFGFGSPG